MQSTPAVFVALRTAVEPRLAQVLDAAAEHATRRATEALPIVDAVRAITLRGGKRLRPAMLLAAVECARPWEELRDAVVDLGASLELLQTYLLIHDDWMDGDALRRGAQTAHVALEARFKDAHLAASLAVLAGDHAAALAQKLAASPAIPAKCLHGVSAAMARMLEDVTLGQALDVLDASDHDAVLDLKTGSYTARGPLALGAAVAAASGETAAALDAFARPLGRAFQLRDDLIGVYGDATETGKTAGSDLRRAKDTAPIRLALAHLAPDEVTSLRALIGRDLNDVELARARSLLDAADVRTRLETEIARQRDEALAALRDVPLRREGAELLAALAHMLSERRA